MQLHCNYIMSRTGQRVSYGLLAPGFTWDADLVSIDRPDFLPTGSHKTWDSVHKTWDSVDGVTFRYVMAEIFNVEGFRV